MERRDPRRSAYKRQVEQMFLGTYEHTLDDKGRLTIPVRYREFINDGAYITKGFDTNLMVMSVASFLHFSEEISKKSVTDLNARLLKRMIFGRAEKVELDRAGRILIPAFLREAVNLKSNTMIVGANTYFEIWSPELWIAQNEKMNDLIAQDAQFFQNFDLPIV